MRGWLAIVSVVTLGLSLPACGSSSTSATPTPTPTPVAKAVIKVLVDPNPIVAVASGDPQYPWAFRVNLQLSDSGGVGFIVTSMLTTVTSAQSGLPLTSTDQNPFVGVKIAAYGQETRQLSILAYRMENFRKEGNVNFKINFVDDRGNASVHDGNVAIQHVGGPVPLPN